MLSYIIILQFRLKMKEIPAFSPKIPAAKISGTPGFYSRSAFSTLIFYFCYQKVRFSPKSIIFFERPPGKRPFFY